MPASPDDGSPVPVPLEETIRAVMERRERETRGAPLTLRIAAAVTNFLGSMWSVVVHAALYGSWIVVNLGLLSGLAPGLAPWDPTFVMLGMIASVEAIFLTTFVLINQNRLAAVEDERSELALQVALLSEKRSSTLLAITARLAERLEVPVADNTGEDVGELTTAIEPGAVIEEIRRQRPKPL
jgi:uncharacterized membrane protein